MAKTDWTYLDTVHPEDMNALGQELNDVKHQLGVEDAPIVYNIQRGQNIVDAVQESGISLKSIKGRTDINHVPLFDSGLWNIHANAVMDSPTKITLNATATHQHTTIQVACKPSTTYTISLLHSGYYNLANVDGSGTVTPVSNYRTDSTYTFTTNSTAVKIQLQLTSGTVGAGTYTFENVMLTEGSELRPFVANMKSLGAVMIENKGKNLLPPAPQAMTSSFVTVTGEYAVRVDGNNSAQSAFFNVDAVPSQSYTLSADHDGYLLVIEYDKNGAEIARPVDYQQGASYTFTTTANTARMQVFLHSNSIAQVFTFSNWMLNLGAEASPFEAQEASRIVIPEVGRSSADGTVCDEVYERDGKLYRLQKFGYKVLDGSLDWSFHSDNTSFKQVRVPVNNVYTTVALNNYTAVKHNGSILKSHDMSVPDGSMLGDLSGAIVGTELVVTIADADSGWAEGWATVSQNAIKSFFNGWKYTGTPDQTTLEWTSIYDSNIKVNDSAISAQRNLHAENGKVGYQIQYQLAHPVEVEIADIGGLSLHAGLNQVELSEGVISGEPVTPVRAPNGNYQINNVLFPYSQLRYRAGRILKIYRDGREDTGNWVIRVPPDDVNNAFGISLAYTTESQYDPTATYSVDYIALDRYLLTTSADEADLEGQANLATAVGKNVRDIADIKRDVTVIERDFARKQQSGWIEPTLLNGATNTIGYSRVAYRLNNFGTLEFKGVVSLSNTVNSTVIFRLPPNYRPKEPKLPSCNTWLSSSDYGASMLRINAIGEVSLVYGTKTYMLLDGITVSLD